MCASVNIVAKEEVIVALDVAIVVRDAPQIKESHQVLILSVDVTEHFDWCVDSEHHWLFLKHAHALVSQG